MTDKIAEDQTIIDYKVLWMREKARVAELEGAMNAQDERERKAAERLGMIHNCDWPDAVADRVAELEARCKFSRLNNGMPEDVFRLLQNGQISVGKACEWLGDYLLAGVQGPIAGIDDAPYDSRLDEKSATELIAELEADNKRLRGEPTYGAAMNSLMEEESKQSLAQLYLEAIGRERRLQQCADAMRSALDRMVDVLRAVLAQRSVRDVSETFAEAESALKLFDASFPREEAKP